METTEPVPVQPVPNIPPQVPQLPQKSGMGGPLIYALVIIILLLLLLFIFFMFLPKNTPLPEVQNTPSPTLQTSPSPFQQLVSEFSQTESFKIFEGRLESLRLENEGVNLSETELAFPLLDMDVSFSNR